MTIKFYKIKEPHGYMSNFKRAPMFLWNRWWNNVEAPYQAAKTIDPNEYVTIWEATSAREARDLGQKVKMRDDWDQIKYDIMKECVLAKFVQHHDLLEQLLETGDEELIEDSPVDWFWGCGADGTGKNMLGKALMEIRTLLRG
jgi:ribA/ribD-fused uncharacterized protein